jgi:AcrR family transcriptional regulator
MRREEILEAAAAVLYERGLLNTRISDVADRAGFASQTVLYYFKSKDQLLEAALDETETAFFERLAAGQKDLDGAAARLVYLIEETSCGPGAINDWTLWMEMSVRARRDPAVRDAYFRLDSRLRRLISKVVRDGQEAGEFTRDANPDDFALAISGLIDGLGVLVTLGHPDVTAERMIECCLDMVSTKLGVGLTATATANTAQRSER